MAHSKHRTVFDISNYVDFFETIFAARAKEEVRIVLAGKTGEGKSALGNAILAEKKFIDKLGLKSETSVCLAGERHFDGRRLVVVDTPGLFDTNVNQTDVAEEIGKAIMMSSPGPHCFIITISARNRLTEEARETINLFRDIFGGNVFEYCIVVFTNEDAIIEDDKNFDDWLLDQITVLPSLAHLLNSCGGRCMAFNSKSKFPDELDKKVRRLLTMIDGMVAKNNGRIYTNDMYKEMESTARQREAEKLRQTAEKDRGLRLEIEQMRAEMREANEALKRAQEENQQMQDALRTERSLLMVSQLNNSIGQLIQNWKQHMEHAVRQASKAREETREETASGKDGWWLSTARRILPIARFAVVLAASVIPFGGITSTAARCTNRLLNRF